jgi:predicted kinase
MTERLGGFIVHINGWPGTGKLTIARILARKLSARLLDNHTLMNPAEALFSRRDPLYASLRSEIRRSAFEHIARAAAGERFVFIDALADDDRDRATFSSYRDLAVARGARLIAVVIDCDPEENLKRLVAAGRAEARKLTDPNVLKDLRARHRLLRGEADHLIEFDVTVLSPDAAAAEILNTIGI